MKKFKQNPRISNIIAAPSDCINIDQLCEITGTKIIENKKAQVINNVFKGMLISNVFAPSSESLKIEHLCGIKHDARKPHGHGMRKAKRFTKKRIFIGVSASLLVVGATVGAIVPLYGMASSKTNNNNPKKPDSDIYNLPNKKVKTYSGTNTTAAKKAISTNLSKFSSNDYENDLKSFINALNNNKKEIKMQSKVNSFSLSSLKTESTTIGGNTINQKLINFNIDYAQKNISSHMIKLNGQNIAPNGSITINLVASNTSVTPSMVGDKNVKYASYTYDNLVQTTSYLDKDNKQQTTTQKLSNYQISKTKSYSMDIAFNGVSDSYTNISKDASGFLNKLTNTQITNDINKQFTALNNKINDGTKDGFSLLKFMAWFTSDEKTRTPDSPGNLSILNMLSGLINLPFSPTQLQSILSSLTREQMYSLVGWTPAEQKIIETDMATLNKVSTYLDSFNAPVSKYVKISHKMNTPVTYNKMTHTVSYQYEYDYTVIKRLQIQLISDSNNPVGVFSDLMTLDLKPLSKLDSLIPGMSGMVSQFNSLQAKYIANKSLADSFALPDYIWIGPSWTYHGWWSNTSFKGDSLKQVYTATNAPVAISYDNKLGNNVSYRVDNLSLQNSLCLDCMASSIWNQYTIDITGFGQALQDLMHSFANQVTNNKMTTVDNFLNTDNFSFDESSYTNKGDISGRAVTYLPNKSFKFAKSPLKVTGADIKKLFKFDSDINMNNVSISLVPIDVNVSKLTFGYLSTLRTLSITLHFDKPVTYVNGTEHTNTTTISRIFSGSYFKIPAKK